MPGFDGTGPAGQGPRTGRGMGQCGQGAAMPRMFGFGRRNGRGMGRGRCGQGCPWFSGFATQVSLEEEEKALEAELEEVRKARKNEKK